MVQPRLTCETDATPLVAAAKRLVAWRAIHPSHMTVTPNQESSLDGSRGSGCHGACAAAPSADSEVDAQEDSSLIASIRQNPPDPASLDELVSRHWNGLYARCHLLTLNSDKAGDLAQDAWCRVLRARHSLKPEGNFPAYLATIATNLWRDSQRHARRAGPMAG